MNCKVVHEREAAHQVYLGTRGVEDAGIATFIGFRRDVNEALVDLTYHLGINGDLLIERAILGDGEVIVFKKIKNYLETEVREGRVVSKLRRSKKGVA